MVEYITFFLVIGIWPCWVIIFLALLNIFLFSFGLEWVIVELWSLLSIPLKDAISLCGCFAKIQSECIGCFCLSSN